jgi:NAD(P)-dependent dehydrogenase (short-subunit alcohol dehydrogenase family)
MTAAPLRFDGRVAVITGAGRGVGSHYARLLAGRGASVVVNDLGVGTDGSGSSQEPAHSVVDEIRAAGGTASANTGNVAVRVEAEALVEQAHREFGRLDILIHNAGVVTGTFEELTAVNLAAAHWLTEAAWARMHEQRYGRILLTTSSAGMFGAANGPTYSPIQSYGATKMGALGLGRCLAVRGRHSNINVNLISPSAATRLVDGLERTRGIQWIVEHAKPELVAPAAVYLVHETCRQSGQVFAVGSGRVARVFLGETTGYVNPQLTPEDVAAHLGEICDETGYHVPADMNELAELYMDTVERAHSDVD